MTTVRDVELYHASLFTPGDLFHLKLDLLTNTNTNFFVARSGSAVLVLNKVNTEGTVIDVLIEGHMCRLSASHLAEALCV